MPNYLVSLSKIITRNNDDVMIFIHRRSAKLVPKVMVSCHTQYHKEVSKLLVILYLSTDKLHYILYFQTHAKVQQMTSIGKDFNIFKK